MVKLIFSKLTALVLFRPFYFLRIFWPVWFYILNRESRICYKKNVSQFSDVQRRVIRDLNLYGIGAAHLEELFPGEDILSRLQQYAVALRSQGKSVEDKPFLLALWSYNNKNEAIDLSNPFVRLSLDPQVLGIVNGYLKMCAKFFFYTLNITLPVPAGSSHIKSQQWHRDPEDIKLCKVFLYLSDVDERRGPFTYVRGSNRGGKWYGLFHPPLPMRARPRDQEVRRVVPPSDIKAFTGRAGTIIFCDTRGLHFGGYATSGERLMFTAEFSPKSAVNSIRYGYPDGFQKEISKLHRFAEYATNDSLGFVGALNKIYRFQQKYFPY